MAKRKDIGKEQILDAAELLLQTRGFNGFSTRDLAGELGISTASLHHHHATKAEMAVAVTRRYRERFNKRMAEIEAVTDDWSKRKERIEREFAAIPGDEGRVCLLGILAAEYQTLPVAAREEALLLMNNLLGWLTRFATAARRDDQLLEGESPEEVARRFLAQLQGELLLSRVR
jgi:TetR/AcrR family transcriptional repressor of nem operon